MPGNGWREELGKAFGLSDDEERARSTEDERPPWREGWARSTEDAGQCPLRKGAEQDSLFDEGYTAAPEADPTVSTKLAGRVARARKAARLTNVVQFVDEELLRLAFRSLRKAEAATDTGVGLASESLPTDLFWGARCVSSARGGSDRGAER